MHGLAGTSLLFAILKIAMDRPLEGELWGHTLAYMTKLAIVFFAIAWISAAVYIFAPFASARNLEFESFLWTFSTYAILFAVIDIAHLLYHMQ